MATDATGSAFLDKDLFPIISVEEPPAKKSEFSLVVEQTIARTLEGNPSLEEAEGKGYWHPDTPPDTRSSREYRQLEEKHELDRAIHREIEKCFSDSPPGAGIDSDFGQCPSRLESVAHFSPPYSDNPSNSATDSSGLIQDASGQWFFEGEPVKILSSHREAEKSRDRLGLGKGCIEHNGKRLKKLSQTSNAQKLRQYRKRKALTRAEVKDDPSNSATGSSDLIPGAFGQWFFKGEPVQILSTHSEAGRSRDRRNLGKDYIEHNGMLLKRLSQLPAAQALRMRKHRKKAEQIISSTFHLSGVAREDFVQPF